MVGPRHVECGASKTRKNPYISPNEKPSPSKPFPSHLCFFLAESFPVKTGAPKDRSQLANATAPARPCHKSSPSTVHLAVSPRDLPGIDLTTVSGAVEVALVQLIVAAESAVGSAARVGIPGEVARVRNLGRLVPPRQSFSVLDRACGFLFTHRDAGVVAPRKVVPAAASDVALPGRTRQTRVAEHAVEPGVDVAEGLVAAAVAAGPAGPLVPDGLAGLEASVLLGGVDGGGEVLLGRDGDGVDAQGEGGEAGDEC